MLISELVSAAQLLIKVHIAGVQLCVFVEGVDQTSKKAVLIEVVVHDIFPEIDKQLIVEQKLQSAGFKALFGQG